jgi:hypothetical protein
LRIGTVAEVLQSFATTMIANDYVDDRLAGIYYQGRNNEAVYVTLEQVIDRMKSEGFELRGLSNLYRASSKLSC